MQKLPLLLAPVGSEAALNAALNAKCDEIYFGVENMNMRKRAGKNFKLEDLPRIVEKCKKQNVKTNLTVNSLLYDSDLSTAKNIIKAAKESGISAVIASDMAAILYANKIGMETHASTQISISNYDTVKFYSKFVDRIVLAREVDIEKMKNICNQIKKDKLKGPNGRPLEIEVFAHGALCVAQSGRCGMSLFAYNASANKGMCVQPCRRSYIVQDTETGKMLEVDNNFVLSPSDLCTLGFLDKLVATGVHVLKIEGRGRSPDYISTVIQTYREALDSIKNNTYTEKNLEKWFKNLGSVYNRGFGNGYYLGENTHTWSGIHSSKSTKEKIFVGIVKNYNSKDKYVEVLIQSGEVKNFDDFTIIGDNTGVRKGKIKNLKLDETQVISAQKGDRIKFPLTQKVEVEDKVYILKDRNTPS